MQTLLRYSTQGDLGKPRRIHMRFLVSPTQIIGAGSGRSGRTRPQRTVSRRRRIAAPAPDRQNRNSAGGLGLPLDWLQRRCPCPACRSTSRAGHHPQRCRGASSTPTQTQTRHWRIRRRLDQARPDRHHRHQQAGLAGDGRSTAGGFAAGKTAHSRQLRRRQSVDALLHENATSSTSPLPTGSSWTKSSSSAARRSTARA